MTARLACCEHCERAVVNAGAGWVHTDLRADCYDPWYWARTGTYAEPAGLVPVEAAVLARHRTVTDVRHRGFR